MNRRLYEKDQASVRRSCTERVDHILIIPVVRYLPVEAHRKIIESCGASIVDVRRIARMNILTVNAT